MKHPAKTPFLSLARWTPVATVALTALWVTGMPLQAEAALPGSAGNTIVRNTITVNYKDANGNGQIAVSASVDFTVTTVAAAPTVLSFTPSPGSTDGTGNTQAYTVRILTNSNGPGAVSFGTGDGTFSNVAAGVVPTVPGNIFLGATVIDPSDGNSGAKTVAAAGTITFAVPNDGGVPSDTSVTSGTIGDGIINGLSQASGGDIVYVTDGAAHYYGPFNVTAVSDPAVGAGATAAPGSITLTNKTASPIGPFTPAAGWQIVEAKDVTVTVTQGLVPILTAQNASSWVTTVTATMNLGANPAGTGTVTTNAHAGKISIAKYVRNVTLASVGTGLFSPPAGTFASGSKNFYASGVSGKPGDILEYLAVLQDVGTGSSSTVYATDVMPTYSTLYTGTTYGSGGAGTVFAHASYYNGSAYAETDMSTTNTGTAGVAFGASTGTSAGSTMTFNLGTGCSAAAGGTLANNQLAYIIYQVKIN